MSIKYLILLCIIALLAACGGGKPRAINDACSIFDDKPRWHKHTRRAADKWNVHGPVLLAIMRQESAFDANAKPPRKRFLGIPWKRPSSAFGYPQALDGTWKMYRRATNSVFAQRDSFKDAMDFIGWYVAQSRRQLGISPRDGYANYLAYHEGWGGYKRGSYKRKKWLPPVARRVARQAVRYEAQMKRCGFAI